MTASGTDGDSAPRSGSLLSLAPRTPARRATRPALNPMLAALARSPDPPAWPRQAGATTATDGEPAVKDKVPAGEAVATEPVAEDSVSAPLPEEPVREPAPVESAPAEKAVVEDHQPETANGLVARLRRQFVEGLPEGRAKEAKTSTKTARPKADATPRRSALEEVRFRLSEFRAEILVRAAGRGKPSRRE